MVPGKSTAEPQAADSMGPHSTIAPSAVRLTPLQRNSVPPRPEPPVVHAIAGLLLAAAHSDGELCRRELKAVRKLLQRLLEVEHCPDWLEQEIESFAPENFDLEQATAVLAALPFEQKRYVLEVTREVCDANNAYDLDEERFMTAVVMALQCGHEDTSDLLLRPARSLEGPAKRLFDLAFATTFVLLAWPLLFAVALAVKLTSRGPILFAQRRYGRGGAEIRVWKFRTMNVQEDGARVIQATRDDPRFTPIGGLLRRTSLDELPQFFNVLRGEMSVVGPRPHAVAHNHFYRTQILEYMLRHKVKPGITGLAQVNGWRGETDTLDKMIQRVAFDLDYIRNHTLRLDIRIVLRTIFGRTSTRNAF